MRRPRHTMSCDHTSAEAKSASAPPGSVDNEMSFVIRPGCCKASRLGNETTHRPSEQACALDTEHLITRAASSASWAKSNGRPLSVERPILRLSRRMSSLEHASLSINEGPQSALVAPKPFRTTSGRPCPIRPQAICAPSTWSFSNDSLGIGDVRKSRNDGKMRVVDQLLRRRWEINPQGPKILFIEEGLHICLPTG
jgi:hypothetical protein